MKLCQKKKGTTIILSHKREEHSTFFPADFYKFNSLPERLFNLSNVVAQFAA
ncbi:MAG: hypothetical protein IKI22_05750 [Neisseriaceae bacterium]|nr:hypothetical protein [Neisseriaceae bacterium]